MVSASAFSSDQSLPAVWFGSGEPKAVGHWRRCAPAQRLRRQRRRFGFGLDFRCGGPHVCVGTLLLVSALTSTFLSGRHTISLCARAAASRFISVPTSNRSGACRSPLASAGDPACIRRRSSCSGFCSSRCIGCRLSQTVGLLALRTRFGGTADIACAGPVYALPPAVGHRVAAVAQVWRLHRGRFHRTADPPPRHLADHRPWPPAPDLPQNPSWRVLALIRRLRSWLLPSSRPAGNATARCSATCWTSLGRNPARSSSVTALTTAGCAMPRPDDTAQS